MGMLRTHSAQLADGLIAELVEHCNGIAEVMAWVRIYFRFEFFSGFNFTTAYFCVHIAATFKNVFISSSAVQTHDLSLGTYWSKLLYSNRTHLWGRRRGSQRHHLSSNITNNILLAFKFDTGIFS